VNWERRIRKLEQVFGDDDESPLVTLEEFHILYREVSRLGADHEPPSPYRNRIMRKWSRLKATYTAATKKQEQSDEQTRVPCESEAPYSPAPTCSPPVLTRTTPDETTSAPPRNHVDPGAITQNSSGGKTRARTKSSAAKSAAKPPWHGGRKKP
jgi:hypothetical protein